MDSRILGLKDIAIKDLVYFQEDLKYLTKEAYEKLRNSLQKKGFLTPFIVWIDQHQKVNLLDGHQRLNVLRKIGMNENTKVPCLQIKAENIKQAKENILCISSQYGEMTQETLSDFVLNNNLDIADLSFLKFKGIQDLSFSKESKIDFNFDLKGDKEKISEPDQQKNTQEPETQSKSESIEYYISIAFKTKSERDLFYQENKDILKIEIF